MSYLMKTVSPSLKTLQRGRQQIGKVWQMQDGSNAWRGQANGYKADGATAGAVFDDLVRQMNRAAITGKADARAEEARAALAKRNAAVDARVAAHNGEIAKLFAGGDKIDALARAFLSQRVRTRRVAI